MGKYFNAETTQEILKIMEPLKNESMTGILIKKKNGIYVYYYFGMSTVVRKTGKEMFEETPLEKCKTFEDVLVAVSNAKLYEGLQDFELFYAQNDEGPALKFYSS